MVVIIFKVECNLLTQKHVRAPMGHCICMLMKLAYFNNLFHDSMYMYCILWSALMYEQ